MITKINKKADSIKIFSEFVNLKIGPELQDRVDKRKDGCPVCFLGREGTKKLKEITHQQKVLIL